MSPPSSPPSKQQQPSSPRSAANARLAPVSPASPSLRHGSSLNKSMPPSASSASAGSATASGSQAHASVGLGSPAIGGAGVTPRRNRSIHINIKPDPAPISALGIPLAIPSWLSNSAGSSSASTSTSASSSGSVPHRDFGMSPHARRGSDPAVSHAAALASIHKRGSSSAASTGGPGPRGNQSSRWANTIQNQLHRIERDGLKKTFWSRGRQFGSNSASNSAPSSSGSGWVLGGNAVGRTWDRLRRIPDLLFVESEDPVARPSTVWSHALDAAGGEAEQAESSDTSDLFDDDSTEASNTGKSATTRKQSHARRKSLAARPSPSRKVRRTLDRIRRTLGISRASLVVLILLLLLGIYESVVSIAPTSRRGNPILGSSSALKLYPRDPFKTLALAGILLPSSSIDPSRPSQAVIPGGANPKMVGTPGLQTAKTTAILLNWKRLDNLVIILAHLCAYTGSMFDSVQVWNNNPDIRVTQETLAVAQCPKSKLRIYNSPGNLLFMARYMACAQADTPYCYFQDDDWLVPSLPALHAHFLRNPEGPPVVAAGDDFPIKSGWEWCFHNVEFDLNACFAWLGFGSFVSRARVLMTLEAVTETSLSITPTSSSRRTFGPFGSDSMAMLDNAFTTLQNTAPYVISGKLIPMDQTNLFSTSGEGDLRNELYIQKGLDSLLRSLDVQADASPYPPPLSPQIINVSQYSGTPNLLTVPDPTRRHPYWHHTRSVAHTNDLLFLTNVANLPPPDSVAYQPHRERNLSQWETALEEARFWTQGQQWAARWPYTDAVNGDMRTAWRSPDVIKKGEYVGLDLLSQIDVESRPTIGIQFVLEHADLLTDSLRVEVSIDGYNWQGLQPSPQISCYTAGHLSTLPTPSFPRTFLTSSGTLSVLEAEQKAGGSRWGKRKRLDSCSVKLSSSAGGSRRKGWRFVRLRSEVAQSIGWGVYELRVD